MNHNKAYAWSPEPILEISNGAADAHSQARPLPILWFASHEMLLTALGRCVSASLAP